MYRRTNMAGLIVLIAVWMTVLACGQGVYAKDVSPGIDEEDVKTMVTRATTWLWSQRDKNAGWGKNTHWVLLALRLANLSYSDNNPSNLSLEFQLSSKQMELEIVLLLWRHREREFLLSNLARYTLALSALCMDPREFHGHDLIGTLQHHEPQTDYDYALISFVECNADSHIRSRINRLLDFINRTKYNGNIYADDAPIDTIAMSILAFKCCEKHRCLRSSQIRRTSAMLRYQSLDGSFRNLYYTPLVMQAFETLDYAYWNKSAALKYLMSNQRPDGSFQGNVYITAQVVLAVAPKGLGSIQSLCHAGDGTPATHIITNYENYGKNLIPTSTMINIENNITSGQTTLSSSSTPSTLTKLTTFSTTVTTTLFAINSHLVNVSYTLWVGTNESYHLIVTAPKNEKFYEVMLLAADMSPHFRFSASQWPNGHYVHTIAGYKEEPMSYHYWLLYKLNSPPDLSSPPGNQLVAPGGVDDLEVNDGEYYLFWYKKL